MLWPVELGREESRRCLQDRIGPSQFSVLSPQAFQLSGLFGPTFTQLHPTTSHSLSIRVFFYLRRSFFIRRITLSATGVLSLTGIAVVGCDFGFARGRVRMTSSASSDTTVSPGDGAPGWVGTSGRRTAAISLANSVPFWGRWTGSLRRAFAIRTWTRSPASSGSGSGSCSMWLVATASGPVPVNGVLPVIISYPTTASE